MPTNPASSLFKLTNEPALPAKCIACGLDWKGKKPFIDFGFSLDYYGAVLFCQDCGAGLSNLLGYVAAESVDIVGDVVKQLEDLNAELKQKVKALEDVVRLYGFKPPAESASDSNPFSVFENSEDVDSDSGTSDGPSDGESETVSSGLFH